MIKITTSGFESDQDEFLIGTFGYPFTSTFKLHGHVYVYYNPFTKKITVGLRKFGDIKDDLNRDDTYEFLKSMDAYVSSETKKGIQDIIKIIDDELVKYPDYSSKLEAFKEARFRLGV